MFLFPFFVLLMNLLSCLEAYAGPEQTSFYWNIIRYEQNFEEQSSVAAQIQLRYDFENNQLAEEQLNLSYSKLYGLGKWGFLFTLGTEEAYRSIREYRYALEFESLPKLFLGNWEYDLRLRYEVRDFKEFSTLAHRYRLRNEFSYSLSSKQRTKFVFSSELNFYGNNYVRNVRGFSSHRSIFSIVSKKSVYEWTLSYVNDYRINDVRNELRHILSLSLEF